MSVTLATVHILTFLRRENWFKSYQKVTLFNAFYQKNK